MITLVEHLLDKEYTMTHIYQRGQIHQQVDLNTHFILMQKMEVQLHMYAIRVMTNLMGYIHLQAVGIKQIRLMVCLILMGLLHHHHHRHQLLSAHALWYYRQADYRKGGAKWNMFLATRRGMEKR